MTKTLSVSGLSALWVSLLDKIEEDVLDIDLRDCRFIEFDALISLCSLIEYFTSTYSSKHFRIILPKLNMEGDDPYIIISTYMRENDAILNEALRRSNIDFDPKQLPDAKSIVRFISFLNSFGFTNFWMDKVEFTNFPRFISPELTLYRGVPSDQSGSHDEFFRRYTKIHRLIGSSDNRTEVLMSILSQLYTSAPQAHRTSPLLMDNELKEVFLTQLAENIASHTDTAGYVIARTFSVKDLSNNISADAIIPSCSTAMRAQCLRYGFFEIIISDSGPGIFSTLRDAYGNILKDIVKNTHNESISAEDVIQFALDEFGSRYVGNNDKYKALVDRHSLNQIFQYTRKYGGSFRIISDSICLHFDTCEEIKRGKYGLGFLGVSDKGEWPPFGLHLRIILPHNPRLIHEYPKARINEWPHSYPLEKRYPLFIYLDSELGPNPSESIIIEKAANFTQMALSKKADQLAFDFSGTERWPLGLFMFFLSKLENLISDIHCWGVNLPDKFIDMLSSRWINETAHAIPEEKFLAFPCLSKRGKLYLISKELFGLSEGLSLLFEDKIDDKGIYLRQEYFDVGDILQYVRKKCLNAAFNLDEEKLSNIMAGHPHLFSYKRNQWSARLSLLLMTLSANKILVNRFEEILKETGSIYCGIDKRTKKEQIFEVPATGKYVKEYIWTYRLLQIGTFTDEIARRLKNTIDEYFIQIDKKKHIFDLGAIVCATAPARILAEAIAKLYDEPPPVFDLGAINELDPEEIMSSFEQDLVKTCIIVTDVLDTKTTIQKIIRIVQRQNVEVIAVISIIRFVEKPMNRNFASIVEEEIETFNDEPDKFGYSNKILIPFGILYDYPAPQLLLEPFTEQKHELYWIEPYSLSPFRVKDLVESGSAWEGEEREQHIPERICLLDRKGYIRYGHFKNRNHHNRILIHMPRALRDEDILEILCDDIIDFMGKTIPDVIVVPLHSSINYMISYLNVRLREKSIFRPTICTISVDLKGRGPWYLLPKEAQDILLKVSPKKLLFLDDAILTGRTVETFLRAAERFINQQIKIDTNFRIDEISVYCIVNRVGRAASTKWRKTGNYSGSKFSFREFVRFESPVYTPHDCPLCRDQQRIKEYKTTNDQTVNRITKWVDEQIKLMEPIPTATKKHICGISDFLRSGVENATDCHDFMVIDDPSFYKYQINPDDLRLHSLDGALWWFWERGYRGSPPLLLLKYFKGWMDSQEGISQHVREYLLAEVLLWAIDNIFNLRIHASYYPNKNRESEHIFYELFQEFLKCGGQNIPIVLEKLMYSLFDRKKDLNSLDVLNRIFAMSIDEMLINSSAEAISTISLGLYIVIIRARMNEALQTFEEGIKQILAMKLKQYGDSKPKVLQNIMAHLESEASDNEYQYHLNMLLKERIKITHSEIFYVRRHLDHSESIHNYDYIIDTVQRIERALNIVIPINEKDESYLAKELILLKNWFRKVTDLLESNVNDYAKFRSYLGFIEHLLHGDSHIGTAIETFNPSICEVLQTLNREIKLTSGTVDIPRSAITILGHRSSLRDTLKNHIWDVIKTRHSSSNTKVKVRIIEHTNQISVSILNSWLTPEIAAANVKKGYSFTMEQREWARYGAELHYPEEADEEDYLSMLIIVFQKGYYK